MELSSIKSIYNPWLYIGNIEKNLLKYFESLQGVRYYVKAVSFNLYLPFKNDVTLSIL
jgi:hypothetical protein